MKTTETIMGHPEGWKETAVRLAIEEDGIGVIEIVLILVVLIGLVTVFRREINALLERIFSSVSSLSDDIL